VVFGFRRAPPALDGDFFCFLGVEATALPLASVFLVADLGNLLVGFDFLDEFLAPLLVGGPLGGGC